MDTWIEELNKVRNGYSELQRLTLKIQELEALATKVTPVLSDVPKGSGNSSKDDVWARLTDYKMECQARLDSYLASSKELEQELKCIHNANIRTAMCYYYIDMIKQETIADLMHYSPRQVRNILSKGRKIYSESFAEKK